MILLYDSITPVAFLLIFWQVALFLAMKLTRENSARTVGPFFRFGLRFWQRRCKICITVSLKASPKKPTVSFLELRTTTQARHNISSASAAFHLAKCFFYPERNFIDKPRRIIESENAEPRYKYALSGNIPAGYCAYGYSIDQSVVCTFHRRGTLPGLHERSSTDG